MAEAETDIPKHLREQVSDQAGRYRKGSVPAGPSDLSDGEQHNIDLERRRRAAKEVANRIKQLAAQAEEWNLAAPTEINQAVLDELDRGTLAKIRKNIGANLTKASKEELIKHFCE